MRRTRRLLLAAVVLTAVLVAALQATLLYGLTGIVRARLVPELQRSLGLRVALDSLRANLFRGTLELDGVSVANPDGYAEPAAFVARRAAVDVGLLSLLRRVGDVSSVELRESRLTISRSAEGEVNLVGLYKALPQATPPGGTVSTSAPPETVPAPPPPSAAAEETPMPRLRLGALEADTLVEFIDHRATNTPARVALALRLDGGDIATFGSAAAADWGRCNLRGHLEGNPAACVTDLRARIAPLDNPARPTFDVDGSIAAIDGRWVAGLAPKMDVTFDRASLTVVLRCRKGVFDRASSRFVLQLENAVTRVGGKKKGKAVQLGTVSVVVPVAGSVDKPEVDWLQAITATVLQTLQTNPNALIQSVEGMGESLGRGLNRAIDDLGGKRKKPAP